MSVASRAARAVPGRSGSTLIEVLVSTVVLLVLVGAIGLALSSGSSSYEQAVAVAELEAKARRMVEQIADELLNAERATLVVNPPGPFPGNRVDFRPVEGFAAGAAVVGDLRRIRIVYAPGELDDGLDNDGNGLVDECRLELVPDQLGAPAQVIGLGGWVREFLEGEVPNGADDNANGLVDERGLCMTLDPADDSLRIRLTLERPDPSGRLITRTVETAVRARNR